MEFGSDNQTGASSQILEMVSKANHGFGDGYGDDQWSKQASQALENLFDCELEVFFVATGTASNSLALSCLVQPWETILCHHHAHILLDESTGPEFFCGGSRLIPISEQAVKLEARHLDTYFQGAVDVPPHTPNAAALSITQANEAGQVYSPAEVRRLCATAHDRGLHVHMDGARFANAVAALGCAPADISVLAGVDVLSLGATKCGALMAEAVIFFKHELCQSFIHRRKRSGHLVSKGRFFGAQFVGWLKDDHWLSLAEHANQQARHLNSSLSTFPFIQLQYPCQANELFVTMPKKIAEQLLEAGAHFYDWPIFALPAGVELESNTVFVRLVTSFATTDTHINDFCGLIEKFSSPNL